MYKVKCKLVKFEGDAETFPCHFRYEIGDEIYYDGMQISGRICPHIIISGMPMIYGVHILGHKFAENVPFRYRGLDIRDPSMARYDGEGWRPRKTVPESLLDKQTAVFPLQSRTEKARGAHFLCADSRTLAHFTVEAVDLSDSAFCQPFYRRAISILEKVEAEPDIESNAILKKFTEFQREDISPPLTPVLLEVLVEALDDMGYITQSQGKIRVTGKQPPSRPKVG